MYIVETIENYLGRRQLGMFNAVLGSGRSDDGQYARLEAPGFYWTAPENDPAVDGSTTLV